MALEFTEKDDPRGAYIAGSSGSQTYTPSSGEISQAEKENFEVDRTDTFLTSLKEKAKKIKI